MKKYFLVLLMVFPYLIHAQNNEQLVEQTIDKINIELTKNFVESRGKKFPDDIHSHGDLGNYLSRMYESKNKKKDPRWAYENLHHAKTQYNESKDPKEFILKLIKDYVAPTIEYDKEKVDEIIFNAFTSNNSGTTEAKTVVQESDETTDNVNQIKNSIDGLSNTIASLNREKEKLIDEKTALNEEVLTLKKQLSEKKTATPRWIPLLLGVFIGFLLSYLIPFLFNKIKNRKKSINVLKTENNLNPTTNPTKEQKIKITSKAKDIPFTVSTGSQERPSIVSKPNGEWLVVHASETGKSHLIANPPIPCQDNHAVLSLENSWGIAVSCDGAGSAKLSHEGSKYIADEAVKLFNTIIADNKWIENQRFPSNQDWDKLSIKAFKKLRYDLEQYAKFKNLSATELACTIIVVIYSPIGILTTHIGDGRAGYRDKKGNWKAIISPHKGEEANQTIFLTSNPWLSGDFVMSGVKVPESNIINDAPTAFTLMSDGCESHSFELGYFDKERQKFIEQNNPYPKFFEPLLHTVINMKKEGMNKQEMLDKWSNFVRSGTAKLKNEPDDKTLILGVITD